MDLHQALQYLVGLGEEKKPVEKLEYSGRHYTDKSIVALKEPTISPIHVSTLSGLMDLLGADCQFEQFSADKHLVHVVSHAQVQVVTKRSNHWKDREVLVDCKLTETRGFEFDKFMGHEQFVIGLLTSFVDSAERESLLKLASNVTSEAVVTSQDDGVSQQLAVKAGISFKEPATIRIIRLAPYSTFREVEQPVSEFLVRAKQAGENQLPTLALFDADGGKWKLTAIENIARMLRAGLDKVTVVS